MLRLGARVAKSPNADDAAAKRLVRSIVRRNWPALGGAGVSTILLTLADLAQPWPLTFVIDSVLRAARSPSSCPARTSARSRSSPPRWSASRS